MHRGCCLTCRYFQQRRWFGECGNAIIRCELGLGGECRREPPVARLTYDGRHDLSSAGVWPIVHASAWCGQYRPRKQSDTSEPAAAAAQIPVGTVAEGP